MEQKACLKIRPGFRQGKLTVEADSGERKSRYTVWHCRCDCGRETEVGQTLLQSGKTKSCGCLQSRSITENLKLVDGTSVVLLENAEKRLIRSNTSGYNGVYLNKRTHKWIAQITFKGKTYYLGS